MSVPALNLLGPTSLLSSAGSGSVLLVLFAETGLLIGFFPPGDSLLVTVGVCCALGAHVIQLTLPVTLLSAALGATLGAQTAYLTGRSPRGPLLERRCFRQLQSAARRAEHFQDRYGVGRNLLPFGAFTLWQVIGGLLWTFGVVVGGYGPGSSITRVDHYLLPLVSLIVTVSLIPAIVEFRRSRRTGAQG